MKVLRLVIKMVIILGLAVGVFFAILQQRNRACERIEVALLYDGQKCPLTEAEVLQQLAAHHVEVEGTAIKDLDLAAVYKVLEMNPYVDSIYPIYFSGSTMQVELKLTEFIAHLFPTQGDDYFLCRNGELFPYTPKVREPLLIVTGDLPAAPARIRRINGNDHLLKRIHKMASILTGTPFYRAQFKQLCYNPQHEFELVPSMGRQTILIGNGNQLEEKLSQLEIAYKKGIAYMTPALYSQLDLRYKNRIIATKRQ